MNLRAPTRARPEFDDRPITNVVVPSDEELSLEPDALTSGCR